MTDKEFKEMEQLRKIRAGDVRTASRLIRNLEDDLPEAKTAIKRIFPHTGCAHVVGITGDAILEPILKEMTQRGGCGILPCGFS